MRCARCGTETDAGASFTFYFGRRSKNVGLGGGRAADATSAHQVDGSERVFLCRACQIAARRRDFWKAALTSAAVVVLSPAILALIQYPSLTPQPLAGAFSAIGGVILAVPVVAIVVGLGIALGLGLLAKYAMRAFGDAVWLAITWNRPYATSGDDPDLDGTAEGEAFAIRVRQADLKRQGYDAFFTREEYGKLGRASWAVRIAGAALGPLVLLALFLLVLAFIGLGSFLVGAIH